MHGNDTIVSAATPPATGAVAIVRLSGAKAFAIADKLFRPENGKPLADFPPRFAVYGAILGQDGKPVDFGLALCFPAPNSYTGENVVEISCHGGMLLVSKILALCHQLGARAALPGEYTKRAFLNNKLSLSQAEAVADLIHAETTEGAENAASQLAGRMGIELDKIHDTLLEHAAAFTAYIDYTDEGVEPPDMGETRQSLASIGRRLSALAESFAVGRLYTEGVACVLLGKPNTGKSSLLNLLTGTNRAIVTHIPGTTRDTLEASTRFGGVLLRLVDTAGLRESVDLVEQLGVERTLEATGQAGLLLAVFDGSAPLSSDDLAVIAKAEESGKPAIFVQNKADLPQNPETSAFLAGKNPVLLSAQTGEGLDGLEAKVAALFAKGNLAFDGSIITNRRQAEALARAGQQAANASKALAEGFTPDVAWVSMESALAALSEVTGRAVSEDVLTRVFERFCVGK